MNIESSIVDPHLLSILTQKIHILMNIESSIVDPRLLKGEFTNFDIVILNDAP